jgi:hypothetical protein
MDVLTTNDLTAASVFGLVQTTFPALPVRPLTAHRAVLAAALFVLAAATTRATLAAARARAPAAVTPERVTQAALAAAAAVVALELVARAAVGRR